VTAFSSVLLLLFFEIFLLLSLLLLLLLYSLLLLLLLILLCWFEIFLDGLGSSAVCGLVVCACGVPYGGFSASFQEERERERWRKGLCINGRSLVVVSCGGVVCVGEPHRRGFEWWVMLELDMSLFAGPAAASCAIPGQPDHHRMKQDVWGVWPCAISGRGAGGVSAARASFGGRARRVVPRPAKSEG